MNIICTKFSDHRGLLSYKASRSLFAWVNLMFNRLSEERIKEVGPDQACAEWLLRNGASIQWKEMTDMVTDYNELPLDKQGHTKGPPLHIQVVNATKATIMSNGFPHFKGCKYIDKIILRQCYLLSDSALPHLQALQSTLTYLEVNSCPSISDEGLLSLAVLRNLKTLKLENLESVKDKSSIQQKLQTALPGTNVSYDITGSM